MVASDYLRGARVAVVGAGVVGSVVAYRLAQAGAEVRLVERRSPASGTSGSTFAYVNGTDKPPRSYHRLSMSAIRDHEDLADELGGDWLHVDGSLHWAEDADHVAEVRRIMRRLLEWGARADRLTPRQATAELEPDIRIDSDRVTEVWRVDRAGWLDPVALATSAIGEASRRYGAVLVRGEVVGMPTQGDVVTRVVLDDGTELESDVVVDAAGPDALRLARLAGTTIGLELVPGILVVSAPAPARFRHVLYGPGANLRPDGGSRVMVQRESLDTRLLGGARPDRLDDPLVEEAMAAARDVLPALASVGAEAVRVGVRPMPADGLPIVGFDPAVANLYHVVTHSGVTLAARLARLVTEELTGGDTEPLEPYRPGRFAPRAAA